MRPTLPFFSTLMFSYSVSKGDGAAAADAAKARAGAASGATAAAAGRAARGAKARAAAGAARMCMRPCAEARRMVRRRDERNMGTACVVVQAIGGREGTGSTFSCVWLYLPWGWSNRQRLKRSPALLFHPSSTRGTNGSAGFRRIPCRFSPHSVAPLAPTRPSFRQ